MYIEAGKSKHHRVCVHKLPVCQKSAGANRLRANVPQSHFSDNPREHKSVLTLNGRKMKRVRIPRMCTH